MKEVVRGRAPDTMDTLVQQNESPFTAEVLHFPLPAKFIMPQVEAFDGARDPVDHPTLTRIKWSCMGIRTLCDAELSLSH